MKKGLLILVLAWICITLSSAQELKGIRIDSPRPVVVFLNGKQVSPSVQSCFVNGLRKGNYLIEAFSGIQPRTGHRPEKPIFSKQVFYPGDDILLIDIGTDRHPGYFPDEPGYHPMEMSPDAFSELQSLLKATSFESEKLEILKMIAKDNFLTAKQIEILARPFSFESSKESAVKILYPCCVDKQNYFIVLKIFTFDSTKKKIMQDINKMR